MKPERDAFGFGAGLGPGGAPGPALAEGGQPAAEHRGTLLARLELLHQCLAQRQAVPLDGGILLRQRDNLSLDVHETFQLIQFRGVLLGRRHRTCNPHCFPQGFASVT